MTRRRVNKWPEGATVILKCESEHLSYDQRPVPITLREETPTEWIGWPLSWRDRGLSAELPLLFPKFAWKLSNLIEKVK